MSVPPETSDPTRELLVAYLDGELSPEEAREVEQRIGQDARLREEMQSLEKTWNALDELPRATVDDNFSQTTIEMVAVEAQREVAELTAAMPRVRRRRWRVAALLATAAAVVGFVLVRGLVTSPDRQLVQDLPVLWGIEPLAQNADGEFLTLLSNRQPDLVDEYATSEVRQRADAWRAIARDSSWGRRQRLRELPNEEKARLLVNQRQFHTFSENKQSALRARCESIERTAADHPELYRVALAYSGWAGEQTPNTQLELRQIEDPEQRVDRVEQLRREQLARASRDLSESDALALRKAVEAAADRPEVTGLVTELLRSRDQRLDAWERQSDRDDTLEEVRRWSSKFDAAIQSQPALRVALMPQIAFGGDRRRWGGPWPGIPSETRDRARRDWQAIDKLLVSSLSLPAQRGLADDSPERRAKKLRRWMLESATALVDPDSMEDFFSSDSLTDNERMELLALPRDEMDERLRRLYVEREQGGIDPRFLDEVTRKLGDHDGRKRPEPGRHNSHKD